MSKVLFSADWHIKLGQKNVPKEWQKARFRNLYTMLHDMCKSKNIDYHVIGGDIFDSVPSLEELQLFTEFLEGIEIPTYIFDGNHEATRKGQTFFSSLKPIFERLNYNVTVILGSDTIENMDVIPYTELKTFKPENYHNDILLTHVRGEIPPHVKAEIDLTKLDRWKLVLAGDLHSNTNSQRNILYPGSPMTVTFHRRVINTGVIVLDTETLKTQWFALVLPQLVRKTVDSEDQMIATSFDHTIYELTGDMKELSQARKVNPLLDKKIVNRQVDAKINFSNLKSIEEELHTYLTKVKLMKDTDKTMQVFNDYI